MQSDSQKEIGKDILCFPFSLRNQRNRVKEKLKKLRKVLVVKKKTLTFARFLKQKATSSLKY